MKILKRLGIGIVLLPVILICLYIVFEIVGMCVNHISTGRQTALLEKQLTAEINDIDICNVYSWTGNTGNGNHVDRVSEITFSSDMSEEDIRNSMTDNYEYFELDIEDNGNYTFRLVTSAPFADNIEGH